MIFKILQKIQFRNGIRFQATFNTSEYKLYQLDAGPEKSVVLTKTEALSLYTDLQSIRRLELRIAKLYMQKAIRGFCHLYNGEEAIAVGIKSVMRPVDHAITSYRAHGWTYLMSKGKIYNIFSELLGLANGISKGKGGSMHMFCKHFHGGQGIVGSQVSLGTGVALACKYRNTGGIAFICYGDGATNQGQVTESFNMAKLWNLPCIFVCENNNYSMGTSVSRSSANHEFYKQVPFLPGVWVDGMDLFSVRSASEFAIKHITGGKGPIILEMSTYRYFGHSMSDPGTSYRKREEVQEIRKKSDPIETYKRKLLEAKLITQEELKVIDGEVDAKMNSEMKDAMVGVALPIVDLTSDIYKTNQGGKVRGVASNTWWNHYHRAPPP